MSNTLILIYFGKLQLGHTIKTNSKIFQTLYPDIYSIFFMKGYGTSFSITHFKYAFSRKIFLLTDQVLLSGYLYLLDIAIYM